MSSKLWGPVRTLADLHPVLDTLMDLSLCTNYRLYKPVHLAPPPLTDRRLIFTGYRKLRGKGFTISGDNGFRFSQELISPSQFGAENAFQDWWSRVARGRRFRQRMWDTIVPILQAALPTSGKRWFTRRSILQSLRNMYS